MKLRGPWEIGVGMCGVLGTHDSRVGVCDPTCARHTCGRHHKPLACDPYLLPHGPQAVRMLHTSQPSAGTCKSRHRL